MYDEVAADASTVERGASATEVARQRLWRDVIPKEARYTWRQLKYSWLVQNEDWEVWTKWYDARLEGKVSNEQLEVARVMIADEIWEKGAKVLNTEIRRRAKHIHGLSRKYELAFEDDDEVEHAASVGPVEAVPAQGPGPRFRASEEGPVDRAAPAELDAEGNSLKTIAQLRPMALRCAADLKTRLPPNQFGELLSAVDRYLAALNPGENKAIEWGEVWGHGVILQSAADAAERKIAERVLPELEDPAETALESLLTIHGPMILATRDGATLSATASNFRLTREQQQVLRAAALRIAEQLRADKEVITPRAAASVAHATESIGQGPHPERGSVYGLATVKNISIVLIGGAAVATPALVGALLGSALIGAAAGAPFSWLVVEAVKKSPAFNALAIQLGARISR